MDSLIDGQLAATIFPLGSAAISRGDATVGVHFLGLADNDVAKTTLSTQRPGSTILPSFLYYLGIYMQIALIAGRDGIQGEGDATLRLGQVLKEGWVFPVPFLILIF